MSNPRHLFVILLSAALGAAIAGSAFGQSGVFDRVGIIPGHGSHGSFPEESIDLFTGNVTLRYRDIFLPGPNGLNLEVWRVYNSKIYKDWQSGQPGVQAYHQSWVGIGWTMHMGMVHAHNTETPVIEFPDGRLEPAFPDKHSPGKYITRDFLRYEKGTYPKLYFQDGVIWTFGVLRTILRADGSQDPVRLVTKIENSYGQSITIQYNTASPTISTITDGFGRVVTFVSNGTPRKLTQIKYVYKAGQYRTCHYFVGTFPSNGYSKLISFTPPCLPAVQFEYNSNMELTALTTSFGGVLSYTYGDHAFYFNGTMLNSRVMLQKQVRFNAGDQNESVWSYEYPDYNGAVEGTVHVEGPEYDTDVTYSAYDPACPWKLGRIKMLEYGDGSLSETFDWTFQEISDQTWSALGTNMGKAKGPLLASVIREKTGNSTLKEEYQYDDMPAYKRYGLPWKSLNYINGSPSPLNWRTTNYYFSSHSTYEQRYLLSLPGIQQEYLGDGTKLREKLTDYYEETGKWGAVSRVRVPKNGTAQEYNEWTHNFMPLDPQAIDLLISVVGPEGYHQKTTYEYGVKKAEQVGDTTLVTGDISEYDSSVLTIGNRSGAKVYFSYDELGRVWHENWPDDRNDKTTTWRPNGENRAVTTWGENTVTRFWDGMGRDTGYTETGDNVTLHFRKILDAEDRVIASSSGSTDPDQQTHFVLNAAGEILVITDPVDRTTTIEFSGTTKTVRDPRNNPTIMEYSHLPGLPTRVTDAQGHVNINTYDDVGRLLTVNYNNGARWHSFEYDRADNVLAETHPETGRIEYEYSVENWLARKSWGGAVTHFSHRADNGQLYKVTTGDGTYEGREEEIMYRYNEDARVDRIRSTISGWSRENILYDQYGNVTSETIMIDGLSPITITYDYDRNNNLKRTTYPDQHWAETTSNGLNMPESVAFDSPSNFVVSQASYGHAKAVTGLSFGRNGTQYQASYYGSGELNTASLMKGGESLYHSAYNYDGAGNVSSISSNAPMSISATFGYDSLNRLTTAIYSTGSHLTYSYEYDEYGNMRTVQQDGLTTFDKLYDGQNRVIGDPYDPRGNLTSAEGKNFFWNKANQLTYVTDLTGELLGRYLYDERGLRIRALPPLPDIYIQCEIGGEPEEVPNGGEVNFEAEVGQPDDKTFTIRNDGEAALTLYGSPVITIAGANPDQFSVQLQPTTPVPPDSGTTFIVRFEPTSYGPKAGTIIISSDDPDEQTYEIHLNGNPHPEIHIPQVSDGGSWDFGHVPIGEFTEQEFVIQNQGKADLVLSGNPPVVISGDSYNQFVVTEQPETVIPPNCETSFIVTYVAIRLGQSYAQLSIANNDQDENPYNFTLSGYGDDNLRGAAGDGTLNITSPDGGEILVAGSVHPITWTGGETFSYVKLEYSADNGSTFKPIAERAENTGYYSWQVPGDLSPTCLIRISDPDGAPAAPRTLAFGFNLKMAPPSKEDSSEAPLVIRASVPDPETQASLVADLAFAFDAQDLSAKLTFNMAESGRLDLGLFSTTWHNVRLTLDLAGLTGSIMVDGRPLMDGIPLLRIPISNLLPEISVSRAGGESANVWIDDLEIIFEDQSAKPAVEGTTAIKPIVSDRFDRYVVGIFPSQGGWIVGMAPSPTSPDDQAMPPVIPPLESDLASTDGREFISPSASLDVKRVEIGAVSITKNISLPERTPYDVSLASFAIVAELPPAPTEETPTENADETREIDSSAGLLPQTDPQAPPVGDAGGTARTLSAASRGVYYIYSFDGRLLAEYDLYGICQSDYIYSGNRLVAEFKPVQSQYFYFTQDRVRSTRVVTDDTGSLVYAESYDPYGGVQQTWPGTTYEPNRQFCDKERDEESGLDYFGARYFLSTRYRWLSVDPKFNTLAVLADSQASNLYSYCRNNPLTLYDPDGRVVICKDLATFEALQRSIGDDTLAQKITWNPVTGEISVEDIKTSNENFESLKTLVGISTVINVSLVDRPSYQTQDGKKESPLFTFRVDIIDGERVVSGFIGLTVYPKGGRPAGFVHDGNDIRVFVARRVLRNDKSEQARSLAEELYGHAFLYVTGRPFEHEFTRNGFVDGYIDKIRRRKY